MIGGLLLVIITIFIPPLGVFLVTGCGADFLINLLLTILGYFPGHIHAFYLEYQYFHRRDLARAGVDPMTNGRAGGIYSNKVQTGGFKGHQVAPGGYVAPQQGYPPQQGQYGTM